MIFKGIVFYQNWLKIIEILIGENTEQNQLMRRPVSSLYQGMPSLYPYTFPYIKEIEKAFLDHLDWQLIMLSNENAMSWETINFLSSVVCVCALTVSWIIGLCQIYEISCFAHFF